MSKAETLIIKGVIAELSAEDREKVDKAYAALQAVLAEHGGHGLMALALIGSEASE